MTDMLEPGDPLYAATEVLRRAQPIPDGLPDRITRRRHRRQVQRRVLAGVVTCGVVAVTVFWPRDRQEAATAMLPDDSLPRTVALDGAVTIKPADSLVNHTFAVEAPKSASVSLVGDFTDWQADSIQLRQTDDGTWEVTLRLPPGRYRYSYLVDKRVWRADDSAPAVPDDFGHPTSVLNLSFNP